MERKIDIDVLFGKGGIRMKKQLCYECENLMRTRHEIPRFLDCFRKKPKYKPEIVERVNCPFNKTDLTSSVVYCNHFKRKE